MTINELVDKLIEVEQSLDTGTEEPQVSNDGFRKVYQGGY
jgi:hypothetical protein